VSSSCVSTCNPSNSASVSSRKATFCCSVVKESIDYCLKLSSKAIITERKEGVQNFRKVREIRGKWKLSEDQVALNATGGSRWEPPVVFSNAVAGLLTTSEE